MTEPSQYFKGRTVQEQMNEVIGYVDTRAAEVATTAIASDVAQVHQDMLDADADAAAAATSAAAAAGTLANAVKKTGESSQTIEGDITMSTGDLGVAGDVGVQGQLSVLGGCDLRAPVTVPTPSNNTDAATKKYVDDADALKANKTYVDAQDALKISITDINSYAVGLTGNQEKSGQLVSLSEGGFQVKRSENYSIAFVQKNTGTDRDDNTQVRYLIPLWVSDVNDKQMLSLRYNKVNKTHRVFIRIVDSAGDEHDTVIAEYTEA